MSHVVKQEFAFRDLRDVKAACAEKGWTFVEGQTRYAWYGRHVGDYKLPEGRKISDLGTCSHAIRVPGAQYEIGVIAREDGSYALEWDFYRPGGLYEVMGEKGDPLIGAIAAAATHRNMTRLGFRRVEDQVVDGVRRIQYARNQGGE